MSDKFSDIKKRFQLQRKPYEETDDVTVTELLSDHTPGGFADQEALEPQEHEETSGEILSPRNEYGSAFHRVMEMMVRFRVKKSFSASWFAQWSRELGPEDCLEIRKSALSFWKGSWGREVAKARQRYPELPFIYKTSRGLLKGQIDLVYQDWRGQWVLLDYKTNRVPRSGVQEAAKEYRSQLAFYALAFKKLYGEAPRRGVLYFSTPAEAVVFEYTDRDYLSIEEELEAAYQAVLR